VDLDLTFALVSPNYTAALVGTAGDSKSDTRGIIQLDYMGQENDVPKVSVTLVEFDEHETIDQTTPGRAEPIIEFTGYIKDGVFTAESWKIKTEKLPDTGPHITVIIGGQVVSNVKLPSSETENAVFELGLVARSGASEYRSLWRAYVRHYTIRPADGPVMAFITGAEDQTFFTAARAYWKQYADAVIALDGMSLEEIVRYLDTHKDAYGDYGEVNIVCHGNRLSALIRILKGGERKLQLNTLYQTLGIAGEEAPAGDEQGIAFQAANRLKFDYSNNETKGLKETTRIVFRACNIGHRPDLLKALREQIFGNICPVKAPKYLQGYGTRDRATKKPFEFFSEDLQRHVPGTADPPRRPKAKPDQSSQEELMQAEFNSKHPELDFALEKDTFESKITKRTFTYHLRGTEGDFYDFKANSVKDDSTFLAESQTRFDAKRNEAAEYTRWEQWKPGKVSLKDQTKKLGGVQRVVETGNIWVTVHDKTAIPASSFVMVEPDLLIIGSSKELGIYKDPELRPDGIRVSSAQVEHKHVSISTSRAPNVEVKVSTEVEAGIENTAKVFKFQGKNQTSLSGTVPLVFSIGPVEVKMRSERYRLAEIVLSRVQVHWRRQLREDDAGATYSKRTLVVPDVENGEHYGSSEDSWPSDDDLAKLSE